jgi:hypothetical protein
MTALLKLNYPETREAFSSLREFRSVHPESNCTLHRKKAFKLIRSHSNHHLKQLLPLK